MTIQEYLKETRHAASVLIDAFTAEWKGHETAVIEHNRSADDFRSLERESLQVAPGDSDIDLLAAAREGVLNRQIRVRECHLDRLEKIPSTSILCGALLQIAKQGLSTVYGAKSNVPAGRALGATTLREVIWEGRNQAMHFEEGNPNPSLVTCFQALEPGYGPRFSINSGKNLSLYVVDALGWYALPAYEADMTSLNVVD